MYKIARPKLLIFSKMSIIMAAFRIDFYMCNNGYMILDNLEM